MSETKIPKFTEFECKYRTSKEILPIFNRLTLVDGSEFLYVEGPDAFYTKHEGHFGRYRKSAMPNSKFAQWTIKEKPVGAKNNNIRFESNWNVSGTPPEEIHAAALKMGYEYNTTIYKKCHIYTFSDATLVFYTVTQEGSDKEHHFIEIEVDESTIDSLTEEQAWDVIRKYENKLARLEVPISAQKRMKLSLFEMFKR